MLSKLVSDREKSDRFVVSSVTEHSAKLAPLARELQSVLREGETMPDVQLLATLVGRLLVRESAAMAEADRAHTAELGDDPSARDARDLAAERLSSLITRVRSLATARFGQDFGKDIGVSGETPRDPASLRSFAAKFIPAVEAKDFARDPAADRDDDISTFDKARAVAKLRAAYSALDAALGAVDTEIREADATQRAKDRAIARRDEVFSFVASFMSLLLARSGEPELARRVRPSTTRPQVVEEPTPTPEPNPA